MATELTVHHPLYDVWAPDWVLMRDSYLGERQVKRKGQAYLPPTRTMMLNGGIGSTTLSEGTQIVAGSKGARDYDAYKLRAVYQELVQPALLAALGVMHGKPPVIKVPPALDELVDKMSFDGEDAKCLLSRINEHQLLVGRIGLLLDIAQGAKPDAMPYVVTYSAEAILNWDTTRASAEAGPRQVQFVVLNESGQERQQGLRWIQVNRYRVIALAEQIKDVWPDIQIPSGYVTASVVMRESVDGGQSFVQPSLANNTLPQVPFVFVGPRDLTPEPDMPPLLALARIAMAIYRGEADYREALHMQTEQTLVVKGLAEDDNKPIKVGAAAAIRLPGGAECDAKYIGPDPGGLAAMSAANKEDKNQAVMLGSSILTERGNDSESAQALNIRKSSKTATLTSVAITGAAALERMFKAAAEWKGLNPEDVEVTPNLDFGDPESVAKDLVDLMTSKMLKAPLSNRSIHGWMVRNEFTTMSYEEEQDALAEDPPLIDTAPPAGPGKPGAPPFGRKAPAVPAAGAPAKKNPFAAGG